MEEHKVGYPSRMGTGRARSSMSCPSNDNPRAYPPPFRDLTMPEASLAAALLEADKLEGSAR
jgi:hypothetical protein